jgi:hypothetical protein
MSVFETEAGDRFGPAPVEPDRVVSPFAATELFEVDGPTGAAMRSFDESLSTPFNEALSSYDEADLEAEAFEALVSEFEDEEFEEALEALTDETAARHLTSVASWSSEAEAPMLASAELEQWMESIASEADRILSELESHFDGRSVDSLSEQEIEAASGLEALAESFGSSVDVQQQFIGSLIRKAKKVAAGVARVASKGLKVAGKFLPAGRLFALLRKLVRPLLKRVLHRATGKLPASLQPAARRLAASFGPRSEIESAESEGLVDDFDAQLAEALLASDGEADRLVEEAERSWAPAERAAEPFHELDLARARLARDLTEAAPGQPPIAQVEQFIPPVMAAMPLLRIGLRVVGRPKVVAFLASALARLIQGQVGAQAAQALSRHIASTGLTLLGLEAEAQADPALGAEALVAAVEDTIREVMELPAEAFEDELLLEAEVQEAFAGAATRHLPAQVLRPELLEGESESESEHGVWVMMPRVTRPCFRYKKYSRMMPVRISRPMARALVLAGGDTLERRLLETGTRSWPTRGELHLYELLPGAELGHLAAFETDASPTSSAEGADEFEELTQEAATLLAGNPRLAPPRRAAGRPGSRRPGTRYYRLKVAGAPLRRRRTFALRIDTSGPRPVLRVHLRIDERDAQTIAGHLQHRRMVQVVASIRRLVHRGMQESLGSRLERGLARRNVTPKPGSGALQAQRLSQAIVQGVSKQLPAMAPALSAAARDAASGATLTFSFEFPDLGAILAGKPPSPTLEVRPGFHRD